MRQDVLPAALFVLRTCPVTGLQSFVEDKHLHAKSLFSSKPDPALAKDLPPAAIERELFISHLGLNYKE